MNERSQRTASLVAEATALVGPLFVIAAAAAAGDGPEIGVVAMFAALLVWAENAAVQLPGRLRVSPSFMVAMAAITAFDGKGVVLGAAVVGAAGGVILRGIRLRRWRVLAFNCGQYALAAAGAALVHEATLDAGGQTVVAIVAAGIAFAAINIGLVLPPTAADSGVSMSRLWAETVPTLPNYLAFGLLGTSVGLAERAWGPVAVLFLVAPLVIARSVFLAFRRQRDAYARLERLYDFSHTIDVADSLTDAARAAVERIGEIEGAESVRLLVRSGDDVLRATRGENGRLEIEHRAYAALSEMDRALLDGEPASTRNEVRTLLSGYGGAVGALCVETSEFFGPEDVQLVETLANQTSSALQRAALLEQLRHESMHDRLTGLVTRGLFMERIQKAMQSGTAAVIVFDIDGFREVNETLGPAHGDDLLRGVAHRLTAAVRPESTIARLGGDEFGVLVPGASPKLALDLTRRLLSLVGEPFSIGDLQFEVTASAGVACGPDDGVDAEILQHRANVALGSAKTRRTGWSRYRSEDDVFSPRRLALAGDLRRALDEDQLRLHYQPLCDPVTGQLTAVEALIRWRHPVHGELSPTEFIAVAEHTALVHPITRRVLEMAIKQGAEWHRAGHNLGVAVNLSARSLLDQTLPARIAIELAREGLPATALTVELTETAVMDDPDSSIEVLRQIHALGVRVAIDDFGTGYSSLAYLKHLPVDELKIDRSLVAQLTASEFDQRIVGSVISLGLDLGLMIVAEGVEDEETRSALVRMGCPIVQGYLFSRPQPAIAITERLERDGVDRGWVPRPAATAP
jgi:diguanylate cyclase (GGDEF)-like protein